MNKEKIDSFFNSFNELDFGFSVNKSLPKKEGDNFSVLRNDDLESLQSFLKKINEYFDLKEPRDFFKYTNNETNFFNFSVFSFFKLVSLFAFLISEDENFGFETNLNEKKQKVSRNIFKILVNSTTLIESGASFPIYYITLMQLIEDAWKKDNPDSTFFETFKLNKNNKLGFAPVEKFFLIKNYAGHYSYLTDFFNDFYFNFYFSESDENYFESSFKADIKNKSIFMYEFALEFGTFFYFFFTIIPDEIKVSFVESFTGELPYYKPQEIKKTEEPKEKTSYAEMFLKRTGSFFFNQSQLADIKNDYLLKTAYENKEKALEKVEKLNEKVSSIPVRQQSTFEKLEEAFKLVVSMKKNQVATLKELTKIYEEFSLKRTAKKFDKEICSWIFLTFYLLFTASADKENLINDLKDASKSKDLKSAYKKHKNLLKRIPGFLETSQAKNVGWNPKLNMLNKDFAKIYANFFNFYTGSKNPYSEFLNDVQYEEMQNMVLSGREELTKALNDKTYIEKFDEIFYKPRIDEKSGKEKSSVYNLIKNIGDLFAEIEDPIEFKLYSEGLNFTLDISSMLANSCLEMASAALLEQYIFLFQKKFISFTDNGVKYNYSISDLYFELITIQKVLEISSGKSLTSEDLKTELAKIKSKALDPSPGNTSSLLYLIDSEGFFALSGTSFFGGANLELLIKTFNLKATNLKENSSELEKEQNLLFQRFSKASNFNSYNVYTDNKNYWYLFIFLKNKNLKTGDVCLFHDYEFLKSSISNLSEEELAYIFICSVKDRVAITNKDYNGIVISTYLKNNKIPLIENSSINEVNFDFYDFYQKWKDNDSFFFLIKTVMQDVTFANWKNGIAVAAFDFSSEAYKTRLIFEKLSVSSNTTQLLDTLARLLPTTSLLKRNFGLELAPFIEKLLGWIDLGLTETLKVLKTFIFRYKKDMSEAYELVQMQLIKKEFSARIYSFNLLIDILAKVIPEFDACQQLGYIDPFDLSFNTFQEYSKTIKNIINKDTKKSDPLINKATKKSDPLINDPTNGSSTTSITDKEINNALAGSFKNKKVTYLGEDSDKKSKILIGTKGADEVPHFSINSDFELIRTIEQNPEGLSVTLEDGLVVSDFVDFLKPTNTPIETEAVQQISKNYKLNLLKNEIGSSNEDISALSKTAYKLNTDTGITFSDAGYIASVDFKKANPKQLLDAITDFDYTDFVDYTFTNYKILESYKNIEAGGKS